MPRCKDGAGEEVEPGAACLEVSEPKCKSHSAIEGLCTCMEDESLRLACGTKLRLSVLHMKLRCQCDRVRSGTRW